MQLKATKKPASKPEAPKPEATKPEAPTVGVIIGTDGALKFDARWTPEARAIVGTVRDAGLSVVRAGVTAVGALVELFAMGTAAKVGMGSNEELGQSLVGALQFEGAARSTAYGWVKVASAQHACNVAKVPTDALPSDVLKLIHQHGKADPALMAKVATDLLNEPTIRNGRGTVDAKKALSWFDGEGSKSSHSGGQSRKEKVQSLAKKAKRLGGSKDAGIDLLKEAIALLAKG